MKSMYLGLLIVVLWAGLAQAQTRTSFGGFRDTAVQNTAGVGGNATNSYFGHQAGLANTGINNTFLGYQCGLSNLTGAWNTATGYRSLYSNLNGSFNTATGNEALHFNVSGSDNSAVGYRALHSNTGDNNTALGWQALASNTIGMDNTATGWQALGNSTGSSNTAMGAGALISTTTGSTNTALGYQSGHNNQTGSGNVFLGHQAGYGETGSNQLYIDNSNTATPLIGGNFGTNTVTVTGSVGINTAPSVALDVDGTVRIRTLNEDLGNTYDRVLVSDANGFLRWRDDSVLVDLAGYARLASPAFTGTPSLPTGTTAVTQGAGNNSSALATTAFVTAADNLKANLASPTFTGTVTAPTFSGNLSGNATTATTVTTNANLTGPVTSVGNATAIGNGVISNAMLANTAVANLSGTNTGDQNLSDYAFLASPAFTGVPTAPTAAAGTNTTQLATTAFVTAAIPAASTFPSFPDSAGDGGGNTNAYFGHEAGLVNTGPNNTFTGYQSGTSNTTGTDNTAYGYQALHNNTATSRNTAIGANALFTQSLSDAGAQWDWNTNNVAVGYEALYNNQPTTTNSGNSNTGVGVQALYNNTTGTHNTALGYDAGPNIGGYINTTAIGNGATTTASNQVRIGNNWVTSIGGSVAWSVVSDGRFKKKLQEDVPGLAFIEQLRPVSYEMDRPKLNKFLRGEAAHNKLDSLSLEAQTLAAQATADAAEVKTALPRVVGFVAQEVEAIVNKNGYTFSGVETPQNEHDHYSLRYGEFVVPLVKAVQEQQAQIEALQQGKPVVKEDITATAQRNTVQGVEALTANTTGVDNTATGAGGLFSNTTGNDNTATGRDALFDNTSGSYNTASGRLALFDNTTGNYNTALGYDAGTQVGHLNNTTALGHGATTTASNQIRIGNAEVSSIGGYVGWSTLSDTRFKQDIREDVAGLAFIEQLRPISYVTDTPKLKGFLRGEPAKAEVNSEETPVRSIGFAAQEVEQLVKDNGYVFTGVEQPQNDKDHYNLRYAEFVVPLVRGMQEQQAMIKSLQQLVQSQQQQNETLQQEVALLKNLVQGNQ